MNTKTSYIRAIGSALPGDPIDNVTLAKRLGIDSQWIDTFIGTKTRHFSIDIDSGKQVSTLASLAKEAASQALERSGLCARDIDFIVMGTSTPDELMPATVNKVADSLGIDQVPTYQLQSGCAGAVQALDIGTLLLQRDENKNGLVIGGDVCAKHMLLDRDFSSVPASEIVNYVLFGDGAGAVVLTNEFTPGSIKMNGVLNQLTGFGKAPGQTIRWFGERDRHGDEQGFSEDYKAIEDRVPILVNEILWQLLDMAGWSPDDLSYVLPPQLSGCMTDRIAKLLGLPRAEALNCVADTGNNGNALPFFQLNMIHQKLKAGEKAIGICVESSKWIKGGFALEGV